MSHGAGLAVPGLLAAIVWALPDATVACPMCLSGGEETREAYYATTALLIAIPLLLSGSIGLWLQRAADRRSTAPDRSD